MTHAQTFRLMWIDAMLAFGELRRADIAAAFHVSIQQASIDLNTYRRRWPDCIAYCLTRKGYYRPDLRRRAFAKKNDALILDAADAVRSNLAKTAEAA